MRKTKINLDGAVVAITGGGRGIGRCTALKFAELGATIAIADIDLQAAQNVAAEVGNGSAGFKLDVRDLSAFRLFNEQVEQQLGSIDVLVNNAGIMPVAGFLDEADELSKATIDVNLWGPAAGMKAVLPGMLKRNRGHVVNVASLAGKLDIPNLAIYCGSKFGAVGLSLSLSEELRGTGVSVSCIQPTAVRTELTSGIKLGAGLPTVDPEDVATEIVRTLDTRAKQTTVPRYLKHAATAYSVIPDGLMSNLRALTRYDKRLEKTTAERHRYEDRISSSI